MVDLATVLQIGLVLVFPLAMLGAAASDVAKFLIPDWLSIVLVAAFAIVLVVAQASFETALYHFGAGLAIFVLGFGLFAAGLFGGGDVKLLAAATVWTGTAKLLPFLLLVALVGGLLAAILLILRRIFRSRPLRAGAPLARLLSPAEGVPYGLAIGIAGIAVYPTLPMVAPVMSWLAE
jgi:prepilin peptidase CpaA